MEPYRARQIHQLLIDAKHPVFVADRRLDGDSLGSVLALADYAHSLGKSVRVFVNEPVPQAYRVLPHVEWCQQDRRMFEDGQVDLIVICDCSEAGFLEEILVGATHRPTVVNIDHHVVNPLYGDINAVDAHAPATAEIIYRFFRMNSIIISKQAATCLLAGVCFDTGIFSNGMTDQRALNAASDLVLCGARIQDIIRSLYQNRSVSALRLWGRALERIRVHEELGFASTYLMRSDLEEIGVSDEDVAGISNFLNLVLETDPVFVLKETAQGGVNVSMRTVHGNVAGVAERFGGGGHKRAAGFTIPESRIVCRQDGEWSVERQARFLP